MSKQPSSRGKGSLSFMRFFEKALDALRPPFMKFLVVLVVAALLGLSLQRECDSSSPDFVLFVALLLIFACLAATLHYAEMKHVEMKHVEKNLRYAQRTEEQLKSVLREVVTELQEEKTGRTLLNPVKLVQVLDTRFDTEELRTFCIHLSTLYPERMTHPNLDYDSLQGEGKAAKMRELVLYCQRRGMLDELASAIRDQRPDIEIYLQLEFYLIATRAAR